MKTLKHIPHMAHNARTAADLMTPNPLSIRSDMSVLDAANFLAVRGMITVPVTDEAGRPVGVLRNSDIRRHKAEWSMSRAGTHEDEGSLSRPAFSEVVHGHDAEHRATVSDAMTRAFDCIRPETSAAEVVEKMLALKVRRLLVVNNEGILIGAISTHDILRELRRWSAKASVDVSVLDPVRSLSALLQE